MKRRKPKAERKELTLRIRVTAEQKERLEAAAKEVGAPVSTWLLGLGLRAAKKADGDGKA
ncbi:MAG: toxin-antitoxin system HicB family antitoxin [Myxococcales bacterium]|nr:toxin-antitoxin system HicB family antitoxin [Myxococcales bacterium]